MYFFQFYIKMKQIYNSQVTINNYLSYSPINGHKVLLVTSKCKLILYDEHKPYKSRNHSRYC